MPAPLAINRIQLFPSSPAVRIAPVAIGGSVIQAEDYLVFMTILVQPSLAMRGRVPVKSFPYLLFATRDATPTG